MKTDFYKKSETPETILENLANKTGLAIVSVEGEDSQIIAKANNNSICEVLYNSETFAPKCAMFCGKAVEEAIKAGESVAVKCHANLNYFTVPLKNEENRELAVIVGRTFLTSDDYRDATERAMTGDWQQFSTEDLFKNVLLTSSTDKIENAVKQLEKISEKTGKLSGIGKKTVVQDLPTEAHENILPTQQTDEITKLIEQFHQKISDETIANNPITEKNTEENEALATWRSLFSSLLDLSYREACLSVLKFLSDRYQISDWAWLEKRNNIFEAVSGIGKFEGQHIQIPLPKDETILLDAVHKDTSLEFRERSKNKDISERQNINLFGIATGEAVNSAVIVSDELKNSNSKQHINKFLRNVAWELEILRLREVVERQSWTTKAIQKLNETIKNIDSDDYWTILAQVSAELMNAEQSSLLLFDEDSHEFLLKAAVGSRSDLIKKESSSLLGARVAQNVLRSGKPLVITDTVKAGLKTYDILPYKTKSFISYPIIISGRKIGVLNITDKIDGDIYTENDLELLHTLIPQIAVSLDRTSLIRKAGEFEQLSITDSLTGLVNRRYLEQRLTEEIKRSQRDGYPLSFMMIDADSFKEYNDTFGHPEGDRVLQIIGQCLKATLRGADVAARYGGEEFSILLPQTTLSEAFTIAERLRMKIEATKFPNRQITVSMGVSTGSKTISTAEELISAADEALYSAKRKGRNNVQIYQNSINFDVDF